METDDIQKEVNELMEEILNHLDGILEDVGRMTSGNFMHNKNSVKTRVKFIQQILNMVPKGTLKDEEMLLEALQSSASNYAYDAEDEDFDIIVRIKSEDGWVSCGIIKNEICPAQEN